MIELSLTKESLAYIDCLLEHLGKERLYGEIDRFFDRQSSIVARKVTVSAFRGLLKTRTGNLSRSILGRGERLAGVPALRIGIFRGPALRYAGVQEFGTKGKNPDSPYDTIKPKKAKALAIPEGKALTPAGVPRFESPRGYPGQLRFIPFRRGIAVGALYDEKDVARAEKKGVLNLDDIKKVYLLLRRVDIAPKHYLLDGLKREAGQLAIDLGLFLKNLLVQCQERAA